MATRRPLRQSQFSAQLLLASIPILILGGILLVQPLVLIGFVLTLPPMEGATGGTISSALGLTFRMAGAGYFFTALTILTIRGRTRSNRELIFWQAVFLIFQAVLLFLGPFYFETSWWVYLPAVYMTAFALYLMAYATKNLYVRE